MRNRPHQHSGSVLLLLFALCLLPSAGPLPAAAAPAPVTALLREWTQAVHAGRRPVTPATPGAAEALADFYAARDFAPAWRERARARALLDVLLAADTHGLSPADFHGPELRALAATGGSDAGDPVRAARFELLLGDGLLALAAQLHAGKVDPAARAPGRNPQRPVPTAAPEALLATLATADAPTATLEALAPADPAYAALRRELAMLRGVAAAGGWPAFDADRLLFRGVRGADVAALRARLGAEDPRLPAVQTPERFDADLDAAVRRFQDRHGLAPDGVVGPRTTRALAAPVEARIGQLRANLERLRWAAREPEAATRLLVNVPAFDLVLERGGVPHFRTRVIVGAPETPTPTFAARIEALVTHPPWNVPRSIASGEFLPRLADDPSLLRREDLLALDGAGALVTAAEAARRARAGEAVRLVQRPGPTNPLGRLKFQLPNPHDVYLHDTPARQLFERATRAFSHGCVRVERPEALARRLLPAEALATLERALAAGETRTIPLPAPVPVRIVYRTAVAERDGTVRLLPDLYGLDEPLLRALERPVGSAAPAAEAARVEMDEAGGAVDPDASALEGERRPADLRDGAAGEGHVDGAALHVQGLLRHAAAAGGECGIGLR
jgi:murein L,D-transpeptidase YcbB/YkuD